MAISKGKKAAFSLLLLVIIVLVAEAGFRVAFRIIDQDPDSMRLFRHDAEKAVSRLCIIAGRTLQRIDISTQ